MERRFKVGDAVIAIHQAADGAINPYLVTKADWPGTVIELLDDHWEDSPAIYVQGFDPKYPNEPMYAAVGEKFFVSPEKAPALKTKEVSKEVKEAYIDGLGTVRACLDCDVLVSGGPTRCNQCANGTTSVQYDGGIIRVNGIAVADHSALPQENERLFRENARLVRQVIDYQETLKVLSSGGPANLAGDVLDKWRKILAR